MRCRECGAPTYTRIFRQWNNDGTVTGRYSQGIRICHIDAAEVSGLVSGISDRIGYPIDHVVVEGERKASRSITNETFSAGHGLLGLLGRSWGGSPISIKISLNISRSVGHGQPEILEHVRKRSLRLRVREPFCTPVVVGDIWGTFEAIHQITADASWSEGKELATIELEKVRDGMVEEYPGRLELKKVATMPGEVEYDRCRRCGVPREVTSTISWDLDRGIVTNRKTGRREVTIMVESINAVIRELSDELGEDVPRMVQQIEESYTAETMKGSKLSNSEEDYRSALDELRVLGMGNPTRVHKLDGRLEVKIENPFCDPILAGRVAGLYQGLEGAAGEASWTAHDGFTMFEVGPA